MLFAIGSKVKLIYTGDVGTVIGIIDHETVQVKLSDGDEIPVDIENIRAHVDTGQQRLKKTPQAPKISTTPFKGKNTGVLLAFRPFYDDEGLVEYYNVHLVNDTEYNIVFDCVFTVNGFTEPSINSLLKSYQAAKLLRLEFSELNDHPKFEFTLWRSTTMGLDNEKKVSTSIKAKQFFKKVRFVDLLQIEAPCYILLQKFKVSGDKKKETEDLLTYTKRHAKEHKEEILYANIGAIDSIQDKAEFSEEIDLHIEKLTKDHEKLIRSEKLDFQLRVFDDYLDQAIRLGVEKVYVIHGLGTSRLRNKIHARLLKNPYVKTYTNQHHPKYGFGATEIFFD